MATRMLRFAFCWNRYVETHEKSLGILVRSRWQVFSKDLVEHFVNISALPFWKGVGF